MKHTAHDGHKKAPPLAGLERESGLQSSLGRCDQRGGDALAEATAPAESSPGTEQGQGAGDGSGGWVAKEHFNRLTSAGKGPSTDQASCGEADGCQGLAIIRGAADNWSAREVSRINSKKTGWTLVIAKKDGCYSRHIGCGDCKNCSVKGCRA